MKYILLALLLFGVGKHAFVQTFSGTVKDAKTNESIYDATVSEKGNLDNKTKTNPNGRFNLTTNFAVGTFIIVAAGYDTLELEVFKDKIIEIRLAPNAQNVGEVVVTALSLQRSTVDLGYSVQTIDGATISNVKSPNILDNLAGQIAGVTVSQGASGVGSTSKITIRGESSFTNNNPLFVIDGIIINNNSIVNPTTDAASGFQSVDFGNGVMDINSDDIESLTVLKGPSAAALYGTRASNGVVVITTKKGTIGKGLGINFNSTTFIDGAFKLPEFQNKYGQGNNGQFAFKDGLGGGINDNISYSWGPELNNGIFTPQFDSPVTLANGEVVRGGDVAVHGGLPITPTEMIAHPDNIKDFYQTGATTINNLAVTNAWDKGNMRLSFTDMRSKGIIPGTNFNRSNVSGNFNFQPTPKLTISTHLHYARSNSDNRPASGYGSENVNYSLVAWGPRNMDISQLEEYWQPGLEGLQQYSFNYTFFDNPYFTLLENRNSFDRDRMIGNLVMNYKIGRGFTAMIRTGMDYSNEKRELRRAYSSNRFKQGAFAQHDVLYREQNTDFLINYEKKWSSFGVDVSLGGNRMDQLQSQSQLTANALAQPGIYKLSNTAVPLLINETSAQKRINSIYALVKFSFKNFLFLDLTGRNDWSSALATPSSDANVSFFYPSASLGFVINRVVDFPKAISFLKVRASLAQVGNDTDPYQTAGTFVPQTAYNNLPTFSAQSTIPNKELLPEKTNNLELGIDVRFWKNRLKFDITYYDSKTRNQIIGLPVPISSGYDQQIVNGGLVRTRGLEIFASLDVIQKKNFSWNSGFNFSRNVSTVEELPDGATKITLAYNRVYDNVNQTVWYQVEEGGRIGDMYGTGYKKNENGDFIINASGNKIADNNLKKLGNYNPDFILAWNNNLEYKNFSFNFLFDWRQGGILVSRTLALAGVGGQLVETEYRPTEGIVAEGVVNVGTEADPIWEENTTSISAESYYREFYDRNHEENNTYDASYLKLRQFSIAYTFKKTTKATGFISETRTLSVALIGRNLFAISKIPHFDPEQLATQGQQFTSGVENMSYATTRSIGLKLAYNF